MKTLWSVLLTLLMLAAEVALAALLAIGPVKLWRARRGEQAAALVRQASGLVRRVRG